MNVPTQHETLEIVSTEDLERELNEVREATGGSLSGIFGPQSVTWQVNREAAVFLGAGRTLLLQLAHPWVATAIEQHSDTFADPIGRFHRTFSVMFTLVFGTLDQSLGAARRLHRRHAAIRGTLRSAAGPLPAGSFYCANAVPALRWVHATPDGNRTCVIRVGAACADARTTCAPLPREPAPGGLVWHSEIMSPAGLDGFFCLRAGNGRLRHIDCHRLRARRSSPASRRR
jgi:ER-bound oxygenase mpaB/B'/Rubber oxygenase, catalytic domain